jgi:hypothetical protein
VKIFEQLTSLLEQRLKNFERSKEELASAKGMYKSLVSGRNTFFVLNLLSKYRLLDSKTFSLSGKVLELCKHIFERITKWNDLDDVGKFSNFLILK